MTRACALFIAVEPNDAKKGRRITSPEAPPVRLTLSVAEAAKALGISRTLAYELAHTGVLRTVKLGRRVVVPQSALTELLERPSAER